MSFHDDFLKSFADGQQNGRGDINYIDRLTELQTIVAPQLEQIAITFPEYTPHDWNGHIVPLFEIVQQFFGKDELLALPPVTRFLVGVGLYAHDWGMAVSDSEREEIRKMISDPDTIVSDDLMSDERQRLTHFAEKKGVSIDEISDEIMSDSTNFWPEYVRATHAWRSGERIRRVFLNPDKDVALANAGWAVCAGHWLDFKELHSNPRFESRKIGNQKSYPRLAALIVRIVDLFDIGRDRTPFTLRKKVGPLNKTSVMEWDKHDALDQVNTAPLTESTFRIKVTGQCDDPDVWASLNDLRDYCGVQLYHSVRSISDELEEVRRNSNGNESHLLRIPDSGLEWEIITTGFVPIELKFKFAQKGVFEILSAEIYQADPHIFIRELLQNAIDAVRRHQFQCEERITELPIEIESRTDSGGNIVIICRDYGIGMDLRIITDYLAVVGASYYQSNDFKKRFPSLPSISRFGIGILSCFAVADSITVITRVQDKHGEGGKCYEIELNDIERNCVVRDFDQHFKPGTQIELIIIPEKLQKFTNATNTKTDFSILNFLKANAAFAEFPISVVEDNVKELLLPPGSSTPDRVTQFDSVAKLDGKYRWEDELDRIQSHPDISYLDFITVDIEKDLGFSDIEGFVSFPLPCKPEQDFRVQEKSFNEDSTLTIRINETTFLERSFEELELSPFIVARSGEGTSAAHLIYQDGILVENFREIGEKVGDTAFSEHCWINYKGDCKTPLTVSRSKFSRKHSISAGEIIRQAKLYVLKGEYKDIPTLPLHQRARRLGWLTQVLGLSAGEIGRYFACGTFPLIILNSDGYLKLTCENDLTDIEELGIITPSASTHVTGSLALSALASSDSPSQSLKYVGVPCIFKFDDRAYSELWKIDSATKSVYDDFCRITYIPTGLKFVTGFTPDSPILPIKIVERREIVEPVPTERYLQRIWEGKDPLNAEEWALLRVQPPMGADFLFPRLFEFPEGHRNMFAYGTDYFNLAHPAVKFLLRYYSLVSENGGFLSSSSDKHGEIRSWIQRLLGNGSDQYYSYEIFSGYWDAAPLALKNLCETENVEMPPKPKLDEFVRGTIYETKLEALQEKEASRTNSPDPRQWIDGWGVNV